MRYDSRIFVAGHLGMVGAAVVRCLQSAGFRNLLLASRQELDLTDQAQTQAWFDVHRPEIVVLAAAKVGGIIANSTCPADFIRDNLGIALHGIESARRAGVTRLLFLGSSCVYPKFAPQPMPESCLLTSELEPTNEPYALAKIAGLKLCQYYRKQYGLVYHSVMPTNLYGPGDNYHPTHSHVLPALIRRFHEAKVSGAPELGVWGTGNPKREFLHVDDLADALLFLLQLDDPPDWVNVGSGDEVSIRELITMVQEVVGYRGRVVFDVTKPDGTPRKRLDIGLMQRLGWRPRLRLAEGLRMTYRTFQEELERGALREA